MPIALLSDFGLADGYVGIMKGVIAVILERCSPNVQGNLQCIDISHQIPPQDLWAGRFCLMNAVPYFPVGTVFLGVVDPGVGGKRRAIAVQFERGYFVGPDNGLVSGLLEKYLAHRKADLREIAAVSLTNSTYWRTQNSDEISSTFHGRDIFAPVAAYLAAGIPLEQLGEKLNPDEIIALPIPKYRIEGKTLIGIIQHIDHFGNLITTIPVEACLSCEGTVYFEQHHIPVVQTYSDVAPQNLCAISGSHGWLEISLNQGNAQQFLNCQRGDLGEIRSAVRLKLINR